MKIMSKAGTVAFRLVALVFTSVVISLTYGTSPRWMRPACPFHAVTGWWCPGCGLTRGVFALARGHVIDALRWNVFTPIVALSLLMSAFTWALAPLRQMPVLRVSRIDGRFFGMLTIILIFYGVARNILPWVALKLP